MATQVNCFWPRTKIAMVVVAVVVLSFGVKEYGFKSYLFLFLYNCGKFHDLSVPPFSQL